MIRVTEGRDTRSQRARRSRAHLLEELPRLLVLSPLDGSHPARLLRTNQNDMRPGTETPVSRRQRESANRSVMPHTKSVTRSRRS